MTTAMDRARRYRRLDAARRAYRERFSTDAPALAYLGHPRLPELLMQAVEDGTRLTAGAVAQLLGTPRPGPLEWTMSQHTPLLSDDAANPLHAAVCRYADAFPGQGVPLVFSIGPQNWPVAVATLDAAVKAGRPLGWWGIMDALGIKQPPGSAAQAARLGGKEDGGGSMATAARK